MRTPDINKKEPSFCLRASVIFFSALRFVVGSTSDNFITLWNLPKITSSSAKDSLRNYKIKFIPGSLQGFTPTTWAGQSKAQQTTYYKMTMLRIQMFLAHFKGQIYAATHMRLLRNRIKNGKHVILNKFNFS